MSIRRTLSRSQSSRRAILSSGTLLAAVAAALPLAHAQNNEEIIVTGSRVSRSGFDSPQPLTTIDSEQISNLGLVNVGDVLRTMPQNTPFFAETNVGIGNFNVGAQLANLRGLNPFFGTRTLTLVDTKRVIPNSEGGAVDLTLIPSMLVARTEVVTGGASAAYGSDAIAGVVNIILDKELEGFKMQLDYGQTGESDGDDTHAAFAFGTAFADQDRGHLIVGAEYQSQDAIASCSRARDWCAEGWLVGTNAQFNTPAGVGNGLPNFIVGPDAKFATSETGLFTPFGGVQQQFNTNGTSLLPYDPGQFPGGFVGRQGGDGTVLGYDISGIRPDTERYSLMAHMNFDVTDRLEFFAEVAHAHSDALSFPANGALGPIALAIAPDNAFLSPAIQAAAPAGGLLARIFMPDVISARNTTENDTTRFVAGLQGELGEKWTWDAYYQHGDNENAQRLINNVVGALLPPQVTPPPPYNFLGWALDAVRSDPLNPTSAIVCRATLPGDPAFDARAAGCVPLNLFGIGNASQAALDYAYRTLVEDSEYGQDVVGANFRSTIAEGWAGPIAFAAGAELRNEDSRQTHDVANQPWATSFFLTWGGDRGGEIDVSEVYAEIDVPMLETLQTNFAVRRTHNETTSDDPTVPSASHEFTSWKASAIYDPIDWLRLRTTLSRDVRAAGFRELFLPRTTLVGAPGGFPAGITNPWNSNVPEVYFNTSGGNPNLLPETADTATFGVVLSFERFRFSADWFEIDLVDGISPGGLGGLSAQQLVNGCFASGGSGEVCSKVTGFGTADITAVDASSINIGSFLTRGYDLEANYRMDLRNGANLNLRVIGTYLYDMIINNGLGSPPQNYQGQSGPVGSFGGFNTSPDWQATAWLSYASGRFTTTLETRYIGSGKLNVLWTESPPGSPTNTQLNTVTDNSVDDAYYLSWSGSYDFPRSGGRSLQAFWVVNNLLDKDPAVAPGGNGYPTNPVFFDTLGRRLRVGVRFAF
jgi:outer membrane receptor protein involved in Fe transport